jgi:aldose 1-epimerase
MCIFNVALHLDHLRSIIAGFFCGSGGKRAKKKKSEQKRRDYFEHNSWISKKKLVFAELEYNTSKRLPNHFFWHTIRIDGLLFVTSQQAIRERKQRMFVKGIASAVVVFLMVFASLPMQAATQVSKKPFGKMPDGTAIDIYTISDQTVQARIMTYGGTIVSLRTPDKNGKTADIVQGFDSLDGYLQKEPYFGALIGRYGNRIAKGHFTLDGKTYSLPINDGPNSLHGGDKGFDKVVWTGKAIPNGVELTYLSKDGEEGYPGNLTATVRYTLVGSELEISYSATTDKDTVLNLTNHSYFNLAGQGSGDILKHQLQINASHFTPVDSTLIPTGEIKAVAGTPMDFLTPHAIGERIEANDEQLQRGKGYDHNWVLDNATGKLAKAAEVYEPTSGRTLEVLTTQPGLQFYTGNFLDGTLTGKDGKVYNHRYALCLETQHYPDSPNHKNFPSTELKPGQHYHTVTIFKFGTRTN